MRSDARLHSSTPPRNGQAARGPRRPAWLTRGAPGSPSWRAAAGGAPGARGRWKREGRGRGRRRRDGRARPVLSVPVSHFPRLPAPLPHLVLSPFLSRTPRGPPIPTHQPRAGERRQALSFSPEFRAHLLLLLCIWQRRSRRSRPASRSSSSLFSPCATTRP